MKKLSKKKELWEVITPRPFDIDPDFKPEDLIQTMAEFETTDDMNTFLFECLDDSDEDKIIVSISEYDIHHNLCISEDPGIVVDLLKDGKNHVIVVKDKKGLILGKGELNKLGDKKTITETNDEIKFNMIDFPEKCRKGFDNIDSLIFRAKKLKNDLLKNEDNIEKNN